MPNTSLSGKKLSQTRLSSYFSGCGKSIPSESKLLRKRPVPISNMRRRLTFSSSSTDDDKVQRVRSSLTTLSPEHLELIANIPKRKLPAPIFSDDEDSENDFSQESPKRVDNGKKPKTPIVSLSLNRPSCINTSPKKQVNWTPSVICTPSTSNNSSNETTPPRLKDVNHNTLMKSTIKKRIKVLENVVIQTPKKSRQEIPSQDGSIVDNTVKDETKKVNYEQLRVMREFFINVLKHEHLQSLLSADDKDFLYNFFNCERDYQYVCVKLFLWKSMWYNIFKFTERVGLTLTDAKISAMYKCLKDNHYVETEYSSEDLFSLLDILTLKEVREIGKKFKIPNLAGPKDTVVARLIKLCKTQITLTNMMNTEGVLRQRIVEKLGHCVKISSRLENCLYSIYLLNTFTNSSLAHPQDYFTNVSYFNIVFPSYDIEDFNIFYTPQEFIRYADAVKLRIELDKAVEKRNITYIYEICKCAYDMLKNLNDAGSSSSEPREPYLQRFTPNAQYIYILTSGSKHITSAYHEQVMVWFKYLLSQEFCKHKRCDWYCQLALIYSLYEKNYEEAAKLVIKAFQEETSNFSEVQLHDLAHRGKMLNKKTYNLPSLFHDQIAALSPPSCDRDWPKDVLDCKSIQSADPGRKRMYVHQLENGDINYLTVEQTALQHYHSTGYPNGKHCEGSLIIASFCLLFWDLIYDQYVKASFVSKLQSAPLDLYGKHFYINRKEMIDERLHDIEEKWSDAFLKKTLLDNWMEHSHEHSLCAIETVIETPENLYEVVSCIGRSVVSKIIQRLVENFQAYHSGFPDLIVWNVEKKHAKFVEVKSENDKLSIKQKLWLNYLMDIGATVAVCHVEPKASKKKIRSTKPSLSKSA